MPSEVAKLAQKQREEQEEAMSVLASLAGNAALASRVLEEEHKIDLSADELQSLRVGRCRGLYENLQDSMGAHLEESLIREAREVANRAMVLENKLLDATEKMLAHNGIEDPAKAAAHIAKVKQTAIDKLLALTGRPTKITQTQDATAIIRALEGKGVLVALDPVPVPDADVVEEDVA